jgi:hypothetical protein
MLPVFYTERYHPPAVTSSELMLPVFYELSPAVTASSPELVLPTFYADRYPAAASYISLTVYLKCIVSQCILLLLLHLVNLYSLASVLSCILLLLLDLLIWCYLPCMLSCILLLQLHLLN